MGALFGKASIFDPAGLTNSQLGDPLGINRKIHKIEDKLVDPAGLRYKSSLLDPLSGGTFKESKRKPDSQSTLLGS